MSNAPVLISVCIANYNGMGLIDDCIRSVMEQRDTQHMEIIVHDDASNDDSVGHIRRHYPDLMLIESSKNVGFCVANNRMATQAKGDFLLLLNNDAVLAPDALASLLDASNKQNPKGILSLEQRDWETGTLVDRGCLLDPFYNPVPNLDPKRNDVGMVIGACLWLPRSLWNQLGGFPEWFESIAEDLYLCCRARLMGCPVQVSKSSHYRHRQGTSFGGNRVNANQLNTTYRRRRLSERNKTYVMVLCSPTLRLWITLPIHLLLLSAEGITLAIIKRDWRLWKEIYLNLFTSLLSNANKLRIVRHRIQKEKNRAPSGYRKAFLWIPYKFKMLMRYGLPNVN